MPERRLLVGADACVIIEALVQSWGPSAAVLAMAASRVFDLLLVEPVEDEVGARDPTGGWQCGSAGRATPALQNPAPFRAHAGAAPRRTLHLAAQLRHVNNLAVAIAVMQAGPEVFFSSNDGHWKAALGAEIGVKVMTPERFLERLASGVRSW